MCLSAMGRLQIILNPDVESKFRGSIPERKKGDISKKIESLILRDLGIEEKQGEKELKKIISLTRDVDKMILKFYNAEEFSMLAANLVATEWDKIKEKQKIK